MMKLHTHIKVGSAGNPGGIFQYGITNFVSDSDEHSLIILPGGNTCVIVNRDDATPSQMDARPKKTDWHDIAVRIFNEGWNPIDDCPWSLTHEREFLYTQGTGREIYHFCPSRTQSAAHPDHVLWYVRNSQGDIVVVDEECTSLEFMSKLGPHWHFWVEIAWAHIPYDPANPPFNSQVWPLTATVQPPTLPIFD